MQVLELSEYPHVGNLSRSHNKKHTLNDTNSVKEVSAMGDDDCL